MKNVFLLSVLLILTANIYAQDKVFVSDKYGNALKLILRTDGTYQLIYNEGTYEQKTDSIYMHGKAVTMDNFTVVPVEAAGDADSLELTFTNDAGYLSDYNIAIASSNGDDNNLTFFPLFYFHPNTMDSYTNNSSKVTIKKDNFLYIAKKDYVTNETMVSKFEVPENVHGLIITENYNISSNLVAAYNEQGNIVVSENGTNPVEFILLETLEAREKPKTLSFTEIHNVSIDWNFTSFYNDGNYTAPLNTDTVQVNIETSLKDALKNLKANPQSCLLIVNDTKEVFDQFISIHKTAYNDLKYYDETDKNIYNFSFYNLKDDEKNWLDKKGYSQETKLIVLGYNEAVIYSSRESVKKLSTEGYYSYEYTTLARQIKSVANIVLANETLLNKKNSAEQLKTALYNASVNLNHRILFPEETGYATNSESVPSNSVIDTINNYEYTYPTGARLNGVFYKSTITKEELEAVWGKVLDKYGKKADYDKELFHTIYKELNNEGFSMNLLGEQRFIMNKNDFRAFDYLIKYYQTATSSNNYSDDYDYSTYFPALSDVKYLISNVLSRNLSDGYDVNPTSEQKKEIITRYGNYLYDSPNDHYILNSYINSLIANKDEKELFSFYEKFVSRFDTNNIVESLNNYYEAVYDLNWYELKNNFSTMANNVSWYVVDNKISSPEKIKKAIEWSEMSLKLARNNSYYMDTLAQLYYKNGDKQKSISIQEDAIKYFKDIDTNPDTLNEMKNVLQKMKNGTY